jgi:nitric oxide reductase activation protein
MPPTPSFTKERNKNSASFRLKNEQRQNTTNKTAEQTTDDDSKEERERQRERNDSIIISKECVLVFVLFKKESFFEQKNLRKRKI